MNQAELDQVLDSHTKWLNGDGGKRSDLSGADLSGANLRGANLYGAEGFYLLPAQDPRGHSFPHAVQHDGVWRIRAGCRDFSIAEARAHWGGGYEGERWIGDMYLYACDWLERRISGEAQ